ncbi:MAG TPA: O-antigen ligase family protein [Candidatus Eisenbacteria bacterium]|nr:O-antigen ligase family protein [Candidatus Eisenbacteria bacterium]
MTHAGIAVPESRATGGWSRALLVAAATIAPALLYLGLATGAWWPPLLLGGVVALAAWSILDIRATFVVAVLLATFVDYNTGILTLELSIVFSWIAWTALLLYWRSAWKGWVLPPGEMLPGLAVWFAACAFGAAVGLLRGNPVRNLGLELAAALWPAMGLGMMQVLGRRSAIYAGLGLVAIGLIHTGFGLTMLQVYHQRLGGIYFTTVTGIAAVMLWTAALLAPRRGIRFVCLLAMIPMLTHLLFSFTRGYWLGALAGLAAATILAWRNLGRFEPAIRARRLLLLPSLLAIAAATLGLSLLYFGGGNLLDAVGGRFSSSFSTEVSGETLSNVIRLAEYDTAIGAAMRSPIIGNGLGYAIVTREPILGTLKEQWYVHNYYLLLWLKMGIVGLAAFAFLLWRQLRAAKRTADRDSSWLARAAAITAMAVTIQVLVILLTNYSLADVTTAYVFAYVWGFFWAVRADGDREGRRVASASAGRS